jgi:hypothetical protein
MENIDHPLLFIFFMTLTIFAMRGVLVWAAKSLGITGLVHLLGH